jgi:hypothetical protein
MTDLLAATSHSDRPDGWVVLGGLLIVASLVYILSCWWFPYTACGRCKGAGKHSRSDGKVWRPCRRCKGSGRRLRLGRWIYNHVTRLRSDAA